MGGGLAHEYTGYRREWLLESKSDSRFTGTCYPLMRLPFLWIKDTTDIGFYHMACQADFICPFAGVNRLLNITDIQQRNKGFTLRLLRMLETSRCPPVLLTGSS